MKITAIELKNVRSFDFLKHTELSPNINVFVGPNNSGKSTILNSIHLIQNRGSVNSDDIKKGAQDSYILLSFSGIHLHKIVPKRSKEKNEGVIRIDLFHRQQSYLSFQGGVARDIPNINALEPTNLIYPYLSKRKVPHFDDSINEKNANSVTGNIKNLIAKIDRLVTHQFPGREDYIEACEDILGFQVSTLAKGNGKQAVQFLGKGQVHIPLTAMGEGVSDALGLIIDLCVAEENIFIIEEPENNIHPKALKRILSLIERKSKSNQFFISTHSHIVMKHLGAVEGAKVFNITNQRSDEILPKLKLSDLEEVSDPIGRQRILEDLGYDFFDLGLWEGWLFLEESSAETIIRDHLIPWFFPRMKYKLRTYSAKGMDSVRQRFKEFNELFIFLHLQDPYKNKVWIYIDAGEKEEKVIEKLRKVYSKSGWKKSQFDQFSQPDFEYYYPERFHEKVESVLTTEGKKEKREKKRNLLYEVVEWIEQEPKIAKEEFKESAEDVIDVLRSIQKKIAR